MCTPVSAVIITHNRKELVSKAIESVMRQTYPNVELIVVDDASGDESRFFLEEESRKKGFTYIHIPKEESKGANHARNVGIMAARGAYIALLDDDDEWFPEKIKLQATFLDEHPSCDLVHCGKVFEYNFTKTRKKDLAHLASGDYSRGILLKMPATSSCLMARKSLFDKAGFFDEELSVWQDYEFLIRACQVSELGVVRDHLVLYRVVTSDPVRATNQMERWEEAVRYIEEKHRGLIGILSRDEKKKHDLMVLRDGVLRAVNIGDKKKKREYLGEIYRLDPSCMNLVKYIFNRRRFSFWKGEL